MLLTTYFECCSLFVLKLYLVEHASQRETLLRRGGPPVTNATKWRHVFNLHCTLQTFKHRYVCVLCPELMHIYLNCNIDALFSTDRQF